MECPVRPDELEAYSAGALDGARSDEIASHLQECEACQAELERMRREDDALRASFALSEISAAARENLVASLPGARAWHAWAAAGIAAGFILTASVLVALLAARVGPSPADPTKARFAQAWAMLDEGRAAEAAEIFRKVASELRSADDPRHLEALYGLGRSRRAEGNFLEAWVAMEEVATRSSDRKLAVKAMAAGIEALDARLEETGGEFERRQKENLERKLDIARLSG